MTIQDALERAKRLGKERAEMGRVEPPADPARPRMGHDAVSLGFPAPKQFAPLARVHFDLSLCEINKILVTDAQAAAAGAEGTAFRLMRGRLLHRMRGSDWSCVGITSAGPGEGKTLSILNLAMSVARERMRMVYLLDLDMRRPSVMSDCGSMPVNQLSQYFTDGLAPEKVLHETEVEHLVIAGNTSPAERASELLASTRLDELLFYIRHRSPGALILIDLPPALSTDEALAVAPRLDAIFLVVSEGVTRRDLLARTLDMLSDFTIGGIILNRSTAQLGSDYYGN